MHVHIRQIIGRGYHSTVFVDEFVAEATYAKDALSESIRCGYVKAPGDYLVICGVDHMLGAGCFIFTVTEVPPPPPSPRLVVQEA